MLIWGGLATIEQAAFGTAYLAGLFAATLVVAPAVRVWCAWAKHEAWAPAL